jgi:hypothetical protein
VIHHSRSFRYVVMDLTESAAGLAVTVADYVDQRYVAGVCHPKCRSPSGGTNPPLRNRARPRLI